MIRRVQAGTRTSALRFAPALEDLIHRKARCARTSSRNPHRPADPCIFQLSGGTTGIPKLIPRTHNDYAYNSKTAAPVCASRRIGAAARAAHRAQPAARLSGVQGYFFQAARFVLSTNDAPGAMFELIQET
jgi:2,3-dihydroxybenzoate-AMP ligase